MRTRFAALAVAAAMAATAPALADAKHDEAVRLFEKARDLREKNDLANAAEMFALSIASEPSIGAYYNLGLINDTLNDPRAAVEAFRKSRDLARQKKSDAREKDASDALTTLLESRNYVALDTADAVANAPGLRVTIDGDPVPAGQLKGEVFLRGERDHSILIAATGHKEVHLRARNKDSVKIVLGEALSQRATPPPPASEPTRGSGWGWQKWTGVGLMGVGLIGVAYGTIWGLSYASSSGDLSSKQQNAASGCSGAMNRITACNGDMTSPRVQAANTAIFNYNTNEAEAKAEAPAAIGLGIAGLGLIGGGIYLFATAPSGAKEESTNAARLRIVPSVSPRESGLTFLGTF